jgi:tripartite-type tricarboxylate transporter receptor subunit TctC
VRHAKLKLVKTMVTKRVFRFAVVAIIVGQTTLLAFAQTYPSRPVTMIVPFAAGGPTDAITRLLSERMRLSLGHPVIVENVTGATGSIGVARAARAAPDGYTLSIGTIATHVFNGAIYKLQFDALVDFEPVSLLATQPVLIVGRQGLPATDLRELIAWLRANPGKALEGTAGTGSSQHIGGVLFQTLTGTRFQFVPYRGAAPAMNDLVAGQIDLMIGDTAANSAPQIRAGNIKAYAVMAATRMAAIPEIPTVDESGLPGCHLAFWQALWVAKGTPRDVIRKLNAAVVGALADPEVKQRISDLGMVVPSPDEQTSEALATFHKAEIEKWWPIIRAADIKAE